MKASDSSCIKWVNEEVFDFLAAALARGATRLDITGGEPTLCPDLISLIRQARELGLTEIVLQTNGRRLCDKAFARELVDAGLTGFFISLHGPDALTHDFLTTCEGSFKETLKSLGLTG